MNKRIRCDVMMCFISSCNRGGRFLQCFKISSQVFSKFIWIVFLYHRLACVIIKSIVRLTVMQNKCIPTWISFQLSAEKMLWGTLQMTWILMPRKVWVNVMQHRNNTNYARCCLSSYWYMYDSRNDMHIT